MDRWDAVQSVADADVVARALAAGSDVLFFPEGTFVAATGLRPFRLGAFMAAARAGAPVVPLALTRHAPRAARRLRAAPPGPDLALWVGDPIRPAGTDMASLVALRAEAMDRDRRALRRAAARPGGGRAGAARVGMSGTWACA